MKLLISAYACAPNLGSEHAVGWNWTTEVHRQGHEVWALASSAHRDAVKRACQADARLSGIRWVFPEVRGWPLRPGIEPKWERTYNLLWQRAALHQARELSRQIEFDIIHHLTWAGIRAPTFLGSLGPPLIIGPIGGGETSPSLLRDGFGLRGRILERIRDLSSSTITANPLVRKGLTESAVIFASTSDTRDLFTGALKGKILIFNQVAIAQLPRTSPRPIREGPPRLLYAGRLLYWKGVHIAIDAFARLLSRIAGARFTIIGDGPERKRLHALAACRGIMGHVDFIPRLPQHKLFELYDSHDLLVFPSLHDSGGFVVVEALSRGLPVVCLNLGGPKEIVTPASGIIVGTAGRNTSEVAAAMAGEMVRLANSPACLSALSAGAIARASQFLLAYRVAEFYQRTCDTIGTFGNFESRAKHGQYLGVGVLRADLGASRSDSPNSVSSIAKFSCGADVIDNLNGRQVTVEQPAAREIGCVA
jgi:glycosyltransferase involved in cell wall biosynthesis